MLTNIDIHRHYSQRANAKVRKLLFVVLLVIVMAIVSITMLVREVQRLSSIIEFYQLRN